RWRGSTVTGEPGAKGIPLPIVSDDVPGQDAFDMEALKRDAMLVWVGENLTVIRRSAFGQRTLYWSLGAAFVVGLAAHVGGFLLKSWITTEPLSVLADLLYALGWALWTGVILVAFVEIYPEARKRQFKRILETYEAAQSDPARAGDGKTSDQ